MPEDTPQAAAGSAPRVRGTRPGFRAGPGRARFSPACAGNASAHLRPATPRAVQPRVCGERVPGPLKMASAVGSAPRVRGTLQHHDPPAKLIRFSPACAGNAAWSYKCSIRMYGSAPRVRGTRRERRGSATGHRFSPACAGNANGYTCQPNVVAVQPRVCGERAAYQQHQVIDRGSAPRVRGTPYSASTRSL